jgi:hypothetical protein
METAARAVKGRRTPLDADGFFVDYGHPGDYGRINRTVAQVHGFLEQLHWQVTAPDGSSCRLSPEIHTVTEHSDGTISVHPSIVTRTWHGWLKRGVWTAV